MHEAHFQIPVPQNEPVFPYAPGDKARKELESTVAQLRGQKTEIPLIIGGKEVRTGKFGKCIEPHQHQSVVAEFHQADAAATEKAIEAALGARHAWQSASWQDRAAVFLKAGELLATKYRHILNAATMINQSKTAHQAEIDSACELIDFFRFNTYFLHKVFNEQPYSAPGIWNRMEHRGLEGFVVAISPFNFTSIAGNLCASPALMGNTIVWKPAGTAVYSGYFIMKLLEEAGLPPGVVNFLPGPSSVIAPLLWKHRELAGVHFTGSTEVFQDIWKQIGNNISNYRSYPRLVGETGGKDFVFIHHEADAAAAATALTRGAFEYQGQKCSAASRAYVAKSIWPKVRDIMAAQLSDIKMGDPTDFRNFVGAVIDESSFHKLSGFIERAKKATDAKVILGGSCSKETGYFIQPTVIETTNPQYETMTTELFGPVLSVYVYDDKDFEAALEICDKGSPYALTGAIFSQNRYAIATATEKLKFAAGNFYINDKPTGAVVGQQPFGGARASGTNDKAGSVLNLLRWTSPRTIKETFVPPTDYKYPFLG